MSKSETRAARLQRQADAAREQYLDAVERLGQNDSSSDQRYLEQLRRRLLRLQEAGTWAAKRER